RPTRPPGGVRRPETRPGRGAGRSPAPAAAPLPLPPAAAWMPSTSFPVASKFPLGPPAAVCGSGETLGPAPPAGGTMKSAEEGKPGAAAAPHSGTPAPRRGPAPLQPARLAGSRPGRDRPAGGPPTLTRLFFLPELYGYGAGLPLPAALSGPSHDLQPPGAGLPASHPTGYGGAVDSGPPGYFLPAGHTRPNGAPTLESPRIEITPYLGLHHHGPFFQEVEVEDVAPHARRSPSTATLGLPQLEAYRDPSCLSPASSLSSRSCNSEASSYESSCSYTYASPQTSPWQSPCVSPKATDPEEGFPRGLGACGLLGSPRPSPCASPRASVTEESWLGARSPRPASPGNKRKFGLDGRQLPCSPQPSPAPSPHGSPRVSVTDDSWLGDSTRFTSSAIVAAINALSTDGGLDLGDGVPVKARKTTLGHVPAGALKAEPAGEDPGDAPPAAEFPPEEFPAFQHIRKGAFCDQYLSVPQPPYPWGRPRSPAAYASPALPALDWQLPSHSGPYELRIEVQPKSHHRAHYETEGSRGAVKASAGGHPSVQGDGRRGRGRPAGGRHTLRPLSPQLHGYVDSEPLTLQLFIGTADDRLLRPHAFYQVHRITGKTVSTTSHEALLSNTKVLEIPLLPENSMRAIIDCAGILKLRNSDIELRKGETDIGRKNTRVRLVFRVHIPQPNGRTLSLQRSAQELPLVDKQSVVSGPVLGGKKMVLSGHNFLQDSKVVFVEKAPDGHHVWEMEAKTDRELCKANSLVVEIPPFRNQRITSPVQVNFYVCNGKRKRSQCQHFTYLPAHVPVIKTEPADEYEPTLPRGPTSQGLSPPPKPCYGQPLALPPGPGACLLPGFPPCPPRGASPQLHDLAPAPYKGTASPGHCHLGLQPPAGGVLAAPDAHPSSPQPPPALLQPQVSPPLSSRRSPGPAGPVPAAPAGRRRPAPKSRPVCSPAAPLARPRRARSRASRPRCHAARRPPGPRRPRCVRTAVVGRAPSPRRSSESLESWTSWTWTTVSAGRRVERPAEDGRPLRRGHQHAGAAAVRACSAGVGSSGWRGPHGGPSLGLRWAARHRPPPRSLAPRTAARLWGARPWLAAGPPRRGPDPPPAVHSSQAHLSPGLGCPDRGVNPRRPQNAAWAALPRPGRATGHVSTGGASPGGVRAARCGRGRASGPWGKEAGAGGPHRSLSSP
ncbi:Nuclear factor of activated T-cells, cytoplasmic 1 protein, partial [Galemys pyrenaicus]